MTEMLGTVEVNQPIQGIPVSISVLVLSPLYWSSDNNIALVTQLGTYIFELNFNPVECSPCMMFKRHFIPSPTESNPHLKAGVDVLRLVDKSHRWKSYEYMMDSVLSASQRAETERDPKFARNSSASMPGGEPNHLGHRRAAWSPRNIGTNDSCLLVLTSHDHQIKVFGSCGQERWEMLADLSSVWCQHVSLHVWSSSLVLKKPLTLEMYQEKMQYLAISEILWIGINESSVLIMVTASSHIAFFEFPQQFNFSNKIKIIGTKELELPSVSSLFWLEIDKSSGLLVVGNNKGIVKIFYCSFSPDLTFWCIGYADNSEDRLSANHLHLCRVTSGEYLLFEAKHNICVLKVLTITPDYKSLIIEETSFVHVGRLAITGIIYSNSSHIYVAVKEGSIQRLQTLPSQKGKPFLHLVGPVFQSEGVLFMGIAVSPNKTLWAIMELMSVLFDHLIIREPSQINLYQVGSPTTIYQVLLESQEPINLKMDLFESLRLSTCKGERTSLLLMDQDLVYLPHLTCQIYLWLAKMSKAVALTDENSFEKLDAIENMLKKTIIKTWIREIFEKKMIQPLPKEVTDSLGLMCNWIKLNGNPGDKKKAKAVAKSLQGGINEELCIICQSHVPFTSLDFGVCGAGHTLPRCHRTLLTCKPRYKCPHCRVFINNMTPYLTQGWKSTCIFCDARTIDLLLGGRNAANRPLMRASCAHISSMGE